MAITIPAPIVKPFCNTGFETPPIINSDTILANQETGFPPLQATPLDLGGEPCTIDQMNGVLNFYTSQIQALVSGWKFTFDQDVSDQNGGYPAGVILYSPTTNSFQRSLVANNTANFNTTPSYIDDQVNWSSDILINSINLLTTIDFYNTAKTHYTSLAANPAATTNTNNYLPQSLPNSLRQSLTCDLSGNWSWFKAIEDGITGTSGAISYNASNAIPPPVLQMWTSPVYYANGSGYNTGTNIFTAPVAGTYRLNINLSLDSTGTTASVGQKFSIQPVINNVIFTPNALGNFSYEGFPMLISGSITFTLAASDTFYLGIIPITGSPCSLAFPLLAANLSWNF